jgi:uncharacterized protein
MAESVNISEIPAEGVTVSLSIEPTRFSIDEDGFQARLPITAELALKPARGAVVVQGEMAAAVDVSCSRCLGPAAVELNETFRLVFVPAEQYVESGEGDLATEDLDVSVLEGAEIDLIEAVREQIILGLPMQPYCKEDCQGLCPECGADRNKQPCSCDSKVKESPFAALKELMPDEVDDREKER